MASSSGISSMAQSKLDCRTTRDSSPRLLPRHWKLLFRRTTSRLGVPRMAGMSWVESANQPGTDFPLQNLPCGVFRHNGETRIGIAIGDHVLDLRACARQHLLDKLHPNAVEACTHNSLNALMALGSATW